MDKDIEALVNGVEVDDLGVMFTEKQWDALNTLGWDYYDKPKHLKYPNKKRSLRVRKKWFNRFVAPRCRKIMVTNENKERAVFIPYAFPIMGLYDFQYKALAKPRKNDRH